MSKYFSLVIVVLLFTVFPSITNAAVINITPSGRSAQVGDMLQLYVVVDAAGVAVNNAEATITYPTNTLELVSAGKSGSIFSLWIEEPTTETLGSVSFNGGVPNPGYSGSAGRLISLVFRAKAPGIATVSAVNASVRANDGLGTDVLTSSSGANIRITEPESAPQVEDAAPSTQQTKDVDVVSVSGPVIRSGTHPDQARWYKNDSPAFSWDLPADAIEVRTIISERTKATPTVRYPEPISSKTVENLPDGTYYFFLQIRTRDGWGAVSRYQVNIDTTPPRSFRITFPHGSVGFDPQPIILFNTSDGSSGIDHYDVKVGTRGPLSTAATAGSNPYTLPMQEPGEHTVVVTAFDRAGNTTPSEAEFTVEGIEAPKITSYPEVMTIGDILKIRGTTYPNATVDIVVSQDGTTVTTETTKSNTLGDFSIIVSKRLWAGAYIFTARATDDRGARSPETQSYAIRVQLQFFADALKFILDYFIATLAFLLALAGIVGVSVWCWFRLLRFARVLRHESDEVETEIHRAFRVLRAGVAKHIQALHKVRADRTLTEEELNFLEELEDTLADAERLILKKVDDLSEEAHQHKKK